MWKVCQVLKGGRSHVCRSRNATNNFSSSPAAQSTSASPCLHEEPIESSRYHRGTSSKRPQTFTPSSILRSFDQNDQHHVCDDLRSRVPLIFFEEKTIVFYGNQSEQGEKFSSRQRRNSDGGRGRPNHEHEGWDCRCRCRFGEWLGFTTMVAATLHLSRTTIHFLPDREKREILIRSINKDTNNDVAADRSSSKTKKNGFADFKDACANRWQNMLFRAAPVLFPDIFKRWYVLPAVRPNRIATTSPTTVQQRSVQFERESSIGESSDQFEVASCEETPSESPTTSASSTTSSVVRSTSDDCGVQTDDSIGTPFDNFMMDSGRRLAAYSRMTDAGLEHAIGVDLLKRHLYDEAIDYVRGAAKSGHSGALYNMGICYSRGFGVRRDMTKAVEMWRSAADQGHGLSKYQMGVCHARGLGGLAMDHERAVRYMEAASAAGVAEAKTYLAANEYKQGRVEGALELLRQAMANGDIKAKELLQDWPSGDKCNDSGTTMNSSQDGYVFENLAKAKAPVVPPSAAAVKRIENGRRRFWASSSSDDKEDSISTSSSSSLFSRKVSSSKGSNSSILFGEDDEDGQPSGDFKKATTPAAVETVASLLTMGSMMRRSKTAPEFRQYDTKREEVAIVSTGNVRFV